MTRGSRSATAIPGHRYPDLRAVLIGGQRCSRDPFRKGLLVARKGIRTTMGVFALSLLGWDRVRAYAAAMAAWANRDDTPLTTD